MRESGGVHTPRDVMAVVESFTNEIASRAKPQLGRRTKILYGMGDIANAVKMTLFGLFTLYFYTTVMGLPGSLVGIASILVLVWDAVIDPYIGYLSDKAHFHFGRRHAFMLVGALTMGITFWAFLSPPQGLSTGTLFAWLLGSSLLVRTATSVFGVPYFALGAELSEDYHERTSITGIRGILALLGTLGAAALSFVVFFPDRTPGVDPKLDYAGYPAMGLAFGLVMSVTGLIATLGTLSWQPYLPTDGNPEMSQTPRNFFASFLQSLWNPSFRALFTSYSLFFLGVVINNSLTIHYLTYYAQVTASTALSTFQLAFYVGGLVGVVFWLRLSRLVEKHWLYLLTNLATATLMLCALLLVGEGHLFGIGNVRALIVGHVLGGFFGSILWFMPGSMIADVADEDELETGQRREGSFFGIFFFGQQLAAGVSLLLNGVLVDWFAGLVPGQASQSPQTAWRLGLLYSLLPAALLGVAAVLILRYTLSKQRVAVIRAELDRRRVVG
jgi:GPH family glycoside/pentoside/hexuronide:cation symporter